MAQFTRIEVALKMKETGLVPVFYHRDINVCKSVVKACYEGGVRVFEFTNRGDFASLVFATDNNSLRRCLISLATARLSTLVKVSLLP